MLILNSLKILRCPRGTGYNRHSYNPQLGGAEEEGSRVQGQPGLIVTPSLKQTIHERSQGRAEDGVQCQEPASLCKALQPWSPGEN